MAYGVREYALQRKRSRRVRLVILISVLAVVTALGILHQFPIGFRPPGVDALCPFGGLEALYTLIATGTLLQKVAAGSFVVFVATLVVALIFRRSFCGHICPLGTLQELAGRAGRKIFRKRLKVPAAVDRPARYLKYLVLVAVVALSAVFGELVIRPYDPWVAYQHIVSAELLTGFIVGLVVLVVSLVGSLLYDRFFCKYLCPMGAFLGLIAKIGWFRVRRNSSRCTSCGACDRACPANITVSSETEVRSAECLSCNMCVLACPVKGALEVAGPRKGKRTISARLFAFASVGLFVVTIGAASLLSVMEWNVPSIELTTATTGSFNPADIKGSDTFAAVARASGLPKELFFERFGIDAADYEAPIKDAAHRADSGFEVQDVRDLVANRLE